MVMMGFVDVVQKELKIVVDDVFVSEAPWLSCLKDREEARTDRLLIFIMTLKVPEFIHERTNHQPPMQRICQLARRQRNTEEWNMAKNIMTVSSRSSFAS